MGGVGLCRGWLTHFLFFVFPCFGGRSGWACGQGYAGCRGGFGGLFFDCVGRHVVQRGGLGGVPVCLACLYIIGPLVLTRVGRFGVVSSWLMCSGGVDIACGALHVRSGLSSFWVVAFWWRVLF